jgi:hypothetical protein
MASSNGGTATPIGLALYPITLGGTLFGTPVIYYVNTANFNTDYVCYYDWKVEDVIPFRTPTTNCIIVTHRDLGLATVTFTLTATNDDGSVSTYAVPMTLGTAAASGRLITFRVPLTATGQNFQLSMTRAASAGPVSIVKIRIEGRVETTSYA